MIYLQLPHQSAPGGRYRSLDQMDQDHLVDNIADAVGQADEPIRQRMVGPLAKADPELGKRVAMGLAF